jgi:hypothetical protein
VGTSLLTRDVVEGDEQATKKQDANMMTPTYLAARVDRTFNLAVGIHKLPSTVIVEGRDSKLSMNRLAPFGSHYQPARRRRFVDERD